MQIHELNTFSGTPSSSNYLAIDDGTDTGKISGESLLAPVNTRIDNLVSGVTVDSEVIDGRVGADGVTYGSLGTAIRTQVSDLKSDIKYVVGKSNLLEIATWTSGAYISESGVITSYGSAKYTSLIPINEDSFIYYYKASSSSSTTRIHGYDSNGDWVKQIVAFATGSTVMIRNQKIPTSGCAYIRISESTSIQPIALIEKESIEDSINDVESYAISVEDGFDNVLDTAIISPINWIDDTKLTNGRILWDGSQDSSSSYKTTDYIPINNGDVLRFYNTYWNADAQRYELTRVPGERLVLYDANKIQLVISGQYPANTTSGYTVSNVSAKFVRLSYSSSYTKVELTKNIAQEIYTDYFVPYKESIRLEQLERVQDVTPKKIIDCWGDSRTEMNIGTSYSDYLGALLGDPYIVTNRGISGQSIGQVAFRFGANETFLTFENNVIPASGSVNITGVLCSVGSRQGYNMETADGSRGSRCSINGVKGTFVYHRSGAKTFTRDSDGVAVNVFPTTKAIPEPYFDKSHMQIIWAGKNDFSYSSPYVKSGIKANYDAMASMIPHSRFIILGETYSTSSDYASGTENREAVDNINDYLAEKYPNNFINIQSELVENGLTLESITPTEQDQTDISNGFIPTSLMYDATHPNQYGREAIAKIIYQYMTNWGWLS